MKTYLLPEKGTFYKANLHCHSTQSDGRLSPKELKEVYRQQGYSILAISDHDILFPHNDLTEPDFLFLNAYELTIREEGKVPFPVKKLIHINLIAKDPSNRVQVGYEPSILDWYINKGIITEQDRDNIQYAGGLLDPAFTPENINHVLRTAKEMGYFATLNHNSWSNMATSACCEFGDYDAMEIYNHGCYTMHGLHDNEAAFQDLLRQGRKVYAIAADDNHNLTPFDHPNSDSFGGFTMIKAESLDYATIIRALENGNFYASTGPEIYSLYYEDGYVHITCSEAADICMLDLGRSGERVASADGTPITSASFQVHPEKNGFIRFRVTSPDGRKAFTNAYYVDELIPDAKKLRSIL